MDYTPFQKAVLRAASDNPALGIDLQELLGRTAARKLKDIARDIEKSWGRVDPRAKPFLEVLKTLDSVEDNYEADRGVDIVRHFLHHSQRWSGPDADRLRDELEGLL